MLKPPSLKPRGVPVQVGPYRTVITQQPYVHSSSIWGWYALCLTATLALCAIGLFLFLSLNKDLALEDLSKNWMQRQWDFKKTFPTILTLTASSFNFIISTSVALLARSRFRNGRSFRLYNQASDEFIFPLMAASTVVSVIILLVFILAGGSISVP